MEFCRVAFSDSIPIGNRIYSYPEIILTTDRVFSVILHCGNSSGAVNFRGSDDSVSAALISARINRGWWGKPNRHEVRS